MEAVPGHDLPLPPRCRRSPPRTEVPTDVVEAHGRREVTDPLETRDLAEAVRRVKVASVETMTAFDDHRRKVAAETAAEARAVVSGPVER